MREEKIYIEQEEEEGYGELERKREVFSQQISQEQDIKRLKSIIERLASEKLCLEQKIFDLDSNVTALKYENSMLHSSNNQLQEDNLRFYAALDKVFSKKVSVVEKLKSFRQDYCKIYDSGANKGELFRLEVKDYFKVSDEVAGKIVDNQDYACGIPAYEHYLYCLIAAEKGEDWLGY
jgi:hypothetical protein